MTKKYGQCKDCGYTTNSLEKMIKHRCIKVDREKTLKLNKEILGENHIIIFDEAYKTPKEFLNFRKRRGENQT